MTPRAALLTDALVAAGSLVADLALALSEERNAEITEQQRDNSVAALTRRARRLAGQVQHTLLGAP